MLCKFCKAGTAYGTLRRQAKEECTIFFPICPGCDWALIKNGRLTPEEVKTFKGIEKKAPRVLDPS